LLVDLEVLVAMEVLLELQDQVNQVERQRQLPVWVALAVPELQPMVAASSGASQEQHR
jgi:hypothetical protein